MIYTKLFIFAFSAILLAACGTKVPITEQAPMTARPVPPAPPAAPVEVPAAPVREVKPIEAAPIPVVKSGIIYFDFDSFVVKPEFQGVLEAQAKLLASNRSTKISLSGHTDDLGGREYNLALGQKRADAVKRSLSILGVTEAQMEAISFGKEKPALIGTSDDARAKNRRVEMAAP